MPEAMHVIQRLTETIEQRRREMPEGSYTTQLFAGGVDKIGAKISEEAAEVVEAAGEAGQQGKQHLVSEAADLVFHLLVMLGYHQLRFDDVVAELARREGISGLDEKAARANQPK